LARLFKILDVDKMIKSLSSKQFTEWVAFFQMEAEDSDAETKKRELIREASAGEQAMRAKRGRR